MAYRRTARSTRGSRKSRSYSAARRSRSSYSRKAAPRKRRATGKRASAARAPRQQTVRIVIANEQPSFVQRPLQDGTVLAANVTPATNRRARF